MSRGTGAGYDRHITIFSPEGRLYQVGSTNSLVFSSSAAMEEDLGPVCEDNKSPGEEHLDARTVFVQNLPFDLTDSQFEEVFNEIGSVRRCFTIKEKGSKKHRGFGFVQFAMAEDASRAVELKSGLSLQGRKIRVELAKRRVPLTERLSKRQKVISDNCTDANIGSTDKAENKVKRHGTQGISGTVALDSLIDMRRGEQALARTVVLGGLTSTTMRDEAISRAKKIGYVESIQLSLKAEELKVRCLARDGCKMDAAAVLYSSVRAASLAVAALHRETIQGGRVWARQLGGEGSKPLRWRVIIRNLPFQVTESELHDLFSATGFVWEINIPLKDNNTSKGFAFAAFISKADAEKAIKVVNGKIVRNRPVAVDWAVSKKFYEKSISAADSSAIPGHSDSDEADAENESDDVPLAKNDNTATTEGVHHHLEKSTIAKNISIEGSTSEPNVLEEMSLAKRVLSKVAASSMNVEETGGSTVTKAKKQKLQDPVSSHKDKEAYGFDENPVPDNDAGTGEFDGRNKKTDPDSVQKEELKRTIFIQNLPFEADPHDVKKFFMQFGDVESLNIVHHPVTRRPKGTAFLKFAKGGVAEAIVARFNVDEGSPIFAGRKLTIWMAIDKPAAQGNTKDKNDTKDQRNLYLAKEGQILEGTAAAAGVSEKDMQKRQLLEKEKNTKLKSPNFHVSRTRLLVHNIPKTMKEADVKKLFIGAIKSRASKQHPVVKQIKILRDGMKSGISRGVGFIEFRKHEHALVALRVLNNNPETFSPEQRPIVEFAIENVRTLKKRTLRASDRESRKMETLHAAGCKHGMENTTKLPRKQQCTETKRDICVDEVFEPANEKSNPQSRKKKHVDMKSMKSTFQNGTGSGKEHELNTKLITTRKHKRNVMFQEEKQCQTSEVTRELSFDSSDNKLKKERSRLNERVRHIKSRTSNAKTNYGKSEIIAADETSEILIQKRNKIDTRKLPRRVHGEPGDRLDKLISEYHSKYFSDTLWKNKNDTRTGNPETSESIQRWYD